MSDEHRPELQPYQRHILVCTGLRCAPEFSPALYQHLKVRLKELQLHEGRARIQRSQCQCLGICQDGPIAVVYPEGVWYHHLNAEKIERVIHEHLVQGRPVQEYAFHCPAGPNNPNV